MSTSAEKLHQEARFERIVPKVKILRLAKSTTKGRDVNQLSKQTIWLTSGFTTLTSRKTMFAFMVLPRPAKSVQNGAGFSRKTWTYWACRKGKSGLIATERAVDKNAGAALDKRKRNRAVCPKHQIMREERVKVGESRTLARVRRIRATAWSGKGGLHRERRQIPRRKVRASNNSLPRTSRRKHERVSGR